MNRLKTDIIVIGAGIAGLWLHHRLNTIGYHSLLVERESIGAGQTLSAQGIIHGGIKYTLSGMLSGAATSIADMPQRWNNCLNNKGEIDLSSTTINTRAQLMWSAQGLSSKLTTFFSSKALSSKITPLKKADYPLPFQTEAFQGKLYALNEPVLDVASLLKNLSHQWHHRMLHIDKSYDIQTFNTGVILTADNICIEAKKVVFAAGEGNERLLQQLSISKPKMQRRPLQMVLCKGKLLPSLFAHCIGTNTKPLLTITSHKHFDGDTVWYIGGDIAEKGVDESPNDLIQKTYSTLKQLLPWVDIQGLSWATHSINRAEPAQKSLLRPDEAFMSSKGNAYVVWPTKLALTPALADTLLSSIKDSKIVLDDKQTNVQTDALLEKLPSQYDLHIGPALWDRLTYAAQ